MAEAAVHGSWPEVRDEVLSIVEETLRGNWVEGKRDGVPYGYSPPSPGHYPWQWYWDSCFHAIVWRRYDRKRARRELESLLNGGDDEGFIGHTIFWTKPVDLRRRWTYNVTSRDARNTSTIQPPLLAWAWKIAVGDPSGEEPIAKHHRWLEANRDLDGDGLLWIVQPDESGLDSSPKFDALWGRRAHANLFFPFLINRNRKLGWDARRILEAGGPVVCEVVTNVLWGLARLAMGEPSITPTLVERLWDEERGLFLDTVQGEIAREKGTEAIGDRRRVTVSTWSALAPLALPDLPEGIARRLIEDHLLDTRKYWLPVPPTSVSAQEPSFTPRDWETLFVRRYWRGPTWINAAWLIWIGLKRLGMEPEATEMTKALASAVARERLREFYEPRSGDGLGAREFGWSSLIAEMVDPEPTAARSYL